MNFKADRLLLIDKLGKDFILKLERSLYELFAHLPEGVFLVFEFDKAPENLQNLCYGSGGDEDWLVIVKDSSGVPRIRELWIERMDVDSEPDEYCLNDFKIYVGCHS